MLSHSHDPPSRAKILHVEDEAVLARALSRQLTKHGDVTIAPTIAVAQPLLVPARNWAVILIDVTLPDGNGLACLVPWGITLACRSGTWQEKPQCAQ
jgi:CheY-like chemotaxis protein